MTDDTLLIIGIRRGDERAFRHLFEKHYGVMCRFAEQILHDRHLAGSIADDVIFNLWESRMTLHIRTSLRTYLLSAVRNRCINELNSAGGRQRRLTMSISAKDNADFLLSLFADGHHPLGELIEKELDEKIRQCVSDMPEACRTAFVKSRIELKTYAEIAADMGISVNTVKYHIKNALAFMHERLGGYIRWIILLLTFYY